MQKYCNYRLHWKQRRTKGVEVELLTVSTVDVTRTVMEYTTSGLTVKLTTNGWYDDWSEPMNPRLVLVACTGVSMVMDRDVVTVSTGDDTIQEVVRLNESAHCSWAYRFVPSTSCRESLLKSAGINRRCDTHKQTHKTSAQRAVVDSPECRQRHHVQSVVAARFAYLRWHRWAPHPTQ